MPASTRLSTSLRAEGKLAEQTIVNHNSTRCLFSTYDNDGQLNLYIDSSDTTKSVDVYYSKVSHSKKATCDGVVASAYPCVEIVPYNLSHLVEAQLTDEFIRKCKGKVKGKLYVPVDVRNGDETAVFTAEITDAPIAGCHRRFYRALIYCSPTNEVTVNLVLLGKGKTPATKQDVYSKSAPTDKEEKCWQTTEFFKTVQRSKSPCSSILALDSPENLARTTYLGLMRSPKDLYLLSREKLRRSFKLGGVYHAELEAYFKHTTAFDVHLDCDICATPLELIKILKAMVSNEWLFEHQVLRLTYCERKYFGRVDKKGILETLNRCVAPDFTLECARYKRYLNSKHRPMYFVIVKVQLPEV